MTHMRKIELGVKSRKEAEDLQRFWNRKSENQVQKAAFRMASRFENDLLEFMIEKRVKKVLYVRHTDYKWDEGRIDTYFKFFTEDEKAVALDLAKQIDEHVGEYDLTALADMSDDEFLHFTFNYKGENEEIVRKWRNAVQNAK